MTPESVLNLLTINTVGELAAALGGLLVGLYRPWRLLWTDRGA